MSVSFSLLMNFSFAVSLLVVFPTCLAYLQNLKGKTGSNRSDGKLVRFYPTYKKIH